MEACKILYADCRDLKFATGLLEILVNEKREIALEAVDVIIRCRNPKWFHFETTYRLIFILEQYISFNEKARQIVIDNLDHPSEGLRDELQKLRTKFE